MTEAIYYKVEAEDKRFNRSRFSKMLTLKKPDIIPPAAPVMLPPEAVEEGVKITWRASSSLDAARQVLYRRLPEEENWTVLDSMEQSVTTYLDTAGEYEVVYEYALRAIDDDNLESEITLPLKGRRYFAEEFSVIGTLSTVYEAESDAVQLNWTYLPPEYEILQGLDYQFVVYRSKAGAPLSRYKLLRDNVPAYTDKEVDPDTVYKYALMVVYRGGKNSLMSEARNFKTPPKDN